MESLFTTIRWIHIVIGIAGLVVFWVPLVVKKGGVVHRRVGWIFVVCMLLASVTAAILAPMRLALNLRDGRPFDLSAIAGPLFLINVSALTFVSVYHGVQVLRQKTRTAPLPLAGQNLVVLFLPAMLVALSIATVVIGLMLNNPVLLTLPVVGLGVGGQQLWVLLRAPSHRMFWWLQHMSGMLGGCVAAITATLITNAKYVRPIIPAPDWLFWIAPAAIGVPLLFIWQRYYKAKFRLAPKPR